MQKNKLNNVIVLKNISSNIVEEAIIVLKPNVNLKNSEFIEKEQKENNKHCAILKEAEYIIEQYISKIQIKNKQIEENKILKKYKYLKRISIIAIILNFFLLLKLF